MCDTDGDAHANGSSTAFFCAAAGDHDLSDGLAGSPKQQEEQLQPAAQVGYRG
jgi:hypothetical protein